MKIIKIPNFISQKEQKELISHTYDCIDEEDTVGVTFDSLTTLSKLIDQSNLYNTIISCKPIYCVSVQKIHQTMIDIGERVASTFNIDRSKVIINAGWGSQFIMVHFRGSQLPAHKDPKKKSDPGGIFELKDDEELIRANVLLQKPEKGGLLTVDTGGVKAGAFQPVEVDELELLVFNAGDYYHQVRETFGNKARIIYIITLAAPNGTMESLEVANNMPHKIINL